MRCYRLHLMSLILQLSIIRSIDCSKSRYSVTNMSFAHPTENSSISEISYRSLFLPLRLQPDSTQICLLRYSLDSCIHNNFARVLTAIETTWFILCLRSRILKKDSFSSLFGGTTIMTQLVIHQTLNWLVQNTIIHACTLVSSLILSCGIRTGITRIIAAILLHLLFNLNCLLLSS